MMEEAKRQIYRAKDLCEILGCKKSTLCAWEKLGIIPAARRNGVRFKYWLKAEIDAYLATGNTQKMAEA